MRTADPRRSASGTPLSEAERNGHTQVVDLLRQAIQTNPAGMAV